VKIPRLSPPIFCLVFGVYGRHLAQSKGSRLTVYDIDTVNIKCVPDVSVFLSPGEGFLPKFFLAVSFNTCYPHNFSGVDVKGDTS
jgi:hypothetical protein